MLLVAAVSVDDGDNLKAEHYKALWYHCDDLCVGELNHAVKDSSGIMSLFNAFGLNEWMSV